MTGIPVLFILGACLAVSFLLSGMEAGVFALSRLRIRQLMRAGHPQASALHDYLEKPERFLWTILVGNTLANLTAVTMGTAALYELTGRWPALFWTALVGGMFLFYALFDLLPKMLFRQFPNRLCLMMARPFRLVQWLMRPLVGLVSWLARGLLRWTGGRVFTGQIFGNREELRLVMQESGQGLSTEERQMINRVMDLQSATVRQVALPLNHVVTVETTTPLEQVRAVFRERRFEVVPVWRVEGKSRRVVGIITLKSLLARPADQPGGVAAELVRPALYLDENVRWENALRMMQRSGHRLAIVLGPDRREAGIVTLQDMLKPVFGEVKI